MQNEFVHPRSLLSALALGLCVAGLAQPISRGLAVGNIGVGGRTPFPTDAVQEKIVRGTWSTPKAGEEIIAPDGTAHSWTELTANKDGWLEGPQLNGGYLLATVDSEGDKVVLLEAQGHSMVYVNGLLRPGDPYSYGWLKLPIELRAGRNELLFACGRGQMRAKITPLPKPEMLNMADSTIPEILVGEREPLWASVVIVNSTYSPLKGWKLRATSSREKQKIATTIPEIPAMSIRKVAFRIVPPTTSKPEDMDFAIALLNGRGSAEDEGTLTLRVRRPTDVYRRTFISDIDGSVQYYAVNPAQKPFSQNALIFTLHGASVEALGQAEAYSPKEWANIIAPTNRRPFGFDWEDWGRLDLFEVIKEAKASFPHAKDRVVITGHSMGGHGTWINGALFPDRFAAIGPSAGWTSFWTYSNAFEPKNPTPIEALLRRAMNQSDASVFARNLVDPSAPFSYLLHGSKDDNVPVAQARDMLASLYPSPRILYHEEDGAGHWWDSDGPGAACVDWPAMFESFENARIPNHPIALDFSTVNPALSASNYWVTIDQQERAMALSRIRFETPMNNVLNGHTENVHRLTIDYRKPQLWGLTLKLDEQLIEFPSIVRKPTSFEKSSGRWIVAKGMPRFAKSPLRGGPFKSAFQNNMLFVYGTEGSAAENRWSQAKARYDADTFYYRGNGSVDVIADREFREGTTRNRNVIVYGNSDINGAWRSLLSDSPIKVSRTGISIGDRPIARDDLACLFVRPRKNSRTSLVGVVSGTGETGLRMTDRLPYFVSGIAYPDWVVFTPDTLVKGPSGALGAGFFGNDWSINAGDSVWQG